MPELFLFIGFLFLFSRFVYWVGSSLDRIDAYSSRVFLGQITEGLLLIFFFGQFFRGKQVLPFSQNIVIQTVGFCLLIIGVFVAFFAKWQLKDEWVYASSYKKQKGEHVVIHGMYAFIRHPIYTGIVVSYVGAELLVGSWLCVAMLFFFVPFYFQAKKEENFLLQHFGVQYKKYMNQTNMFLPFLF